MVLEFATRPTQALLTQRAAKQRRILAGVELNRSKRIFGRQMKKVLIASFQRSGTHFLINNLTTNFLGVENDLRFLNQTLSEQTKEFFD
jgi:hypothetical protein